MTIVAWRTFAEVCRLGSLSAAADELGYTQSAVSRQVATLEKMVGTPLLRREPRGVRLTAAGEAFRHHARVLVNAADRAIEDARRAANEAGGSSPLVIGATPSTAAGIVAAALRRLRDTGREVPLLTLVTGSTAELDARTVSGDVDVAIVTDAPPGLTDEAQLVRRPLGVDEMCVIVAREDPMARRGRAELARFADATWVEDNEGSAALLRSAAHRAGFSARIDMAAADLTGKTALVASGHGVALIPGMLATGLRPDVQLMRLRTPPTRGIYVSVAAKAGDIAVDHPVRPTRKSSRQSDRSRDAFLRAVDDVAQRIPTMKA